MRQNRGFSLIELLIVVAIIGIIAAIAIPNFTSSRIAANEAAAISAVRTICTAQFTYAATIGNGSFADSVSTLGGTSPPMLDRALSTGNKLGYGFAISGVGAGVFLVTATPSTANVTGIRTFTSDQQGVIYAGGNVVGG